MSTSDACSCLLAHWLLHKHVAKYIYHTKESLQIRNLEKIYVHRSRICQSDPFIVLLLYLTVVYHIDFRLVHIRKYFICFNMTYFCAF